MWWIAIKELRNLLYDIKFILTFIVAATLILISIANGYIVYSGEKAAAEEVESASLARMSASSSYESIEAETVRRPHKLSIFDIGISGLLGRSCTVWSRGTREIQGSRYEADPVLAVFGELDLTFTVTYILSLIAILFGFGSISGERESGTLSLMLAGPTRRTSVVLGKLLGGFIPLALLYLMPLMLGLAGLMLLGDISFTAAEWIGLGLMSLAMLLYLLVFHSLAVAMSALTRSSFTSFMVCLLIWVACVAVIPRGAVQLGAQISPSMNRFEYTREIWAIHRSFSRERIRAMADFFQEKNPQMTEFRKVFDEFQNTVGSKIDERRQAALDRLFESYVLERNNLTSTAANLSRISPSACLAFSLNGLTSTGPELLSRFEKAVRTYLDVFAAYQDAMLEKHADEVEAARRTRSYETKPGPDGYMTVEILDRKPTELDISELPRFEGFDLPVEAAVEGVLLDLGALSFYALLLIAIAYVAFLRYDVR